MLESISRDIRPYGKSHNTRTRENHHIFSHIFHYISIYTGGLRLKTSINSQRKTWTCWDIWAATWAVKISLMTAPFWISNLDLQKIVTELSIWVKWFMDSPAGLYRFGWCYSLITYGDCCVTMFFSFGWCTQKMLPVNCILLLAYILLKLTCNYSFCFFASAMMFSQDLGEPPYFSFNLQSNMVKKNPYIWMLGPKRGYQQ